MGRRWRRRVRKAEREQEPEAVGRCPGGEDADPVVVDLIDLARPPLKLVPLENLLPSVTTSERDAGVGGAAGAHADVPPISE